MLSAKQFRSYIKKAVKQRNLLVLWTDEVLFEKAWDFFVKFAEHKLSFTDAEIIAFVKDLKLNEVLTLDKGFSKVGLSIRPELD